MFLFATAFLAGDLYFQSFTQLPSSAYLMTLLTVSMAMWVWLRQYFKRAFLLLAFVLGFNYSAYWAMSMLNWSLPNELEAMPITIIGTIASLPTGDTKEKNFFLTTDSINGNPSKTLVRLLWRFAPKRLMVGDKWQLVVKLKKVHGVHNSGAFNYEAWALQRGVRASGYVAVHRENRILSHAWYLYPINYVRQKFQIKLLEHLPLTAASPWLVALIIGERNAVTQNEWQILRKTGTNHLMAIAGLHIGIISGFTYMVFNWVWRRSICLLLWMPAQVVASCSALICGVFYSALAGFSLPAQRACTMLAIITSMTFMRRAIDAWSIWAFALCIVLMVNPLSVLTESFWLSFITIALIIYGMHGRLAPSGWWWKWGRVQWVIGFGLIPVTLVFFQECSLISFAANCVAIPWLALSILPFCFLSALTLFVSPKIAEFFLMLANQSLLGLWSVLSYFASLPISAWQQSVSSWSQLGMIMLGVIIMLVPKGFPGRWLGIIWVMPIFLVVSEHPKQGEVWLTLLDVGQGLSTVVQTAKHTLVFDAGPRYGENFDMGANVVVPFLFTKSVKSLDMLVISHGDNDHIGGASAIIDSLPVLSIMTSVPQKLPFAVTKVCQTGITWQWDGVDFEFLHPNSDQLSLGNDSSCVLRIDNGTQKVLLTGDIEKKGEKALLARESRLEADILIAPHHGSKTSGLKEFIYAVKPKYVLYATGYKNRYHFPHASIVAAYQEEGALQFATADTGSIEFKLQPSSMLIKPELYKFSHLRYFTDLT